MAPSSSSLVSLKPNVAYLVLNFCALGRSRRPCHPCWHTRHPVPGFRREGWRAGFDDCMEPLAHGAFRFRHLGDLREHGAFPVRLARLQLLARSFIAARSSSVNPLDVLPIAVVLLADFCVSFFGS